MKKEEHKLQVAIHQYLTYSGVFHFAIPNGSMRNLRVAVQLKHEGVLAGVSDLIVMFKNRLVFVEIKNGKVGRQSENQKNFQRKVEKLGFEYVIWRSLDDCRQFLNQQNQGVIK